MSGLSARLEPETLLGARHAYVWYAIALEPADARTWLLCAAEAWEATEWLDLRVGAARPVPP